MIWIFFNLVPGWAPKCVRASCCVVWIGLGTSRDDMEARTGRADAWKNFRAWKTHFFMFFWRLKNESILACFWAFFAKNSKISKSHKIDLVCFREVPEVRFAHFDVLNLFLVRSGVSHDFKCSNYSDFDFLSVFPFEKATLRVRSKNSLKTWSGLFSFLCLGEPWNVSVFRCVWFGLVLGLRGMPWRHVRDEWMLAKNFRHGKLTFSRFFEDEKISQF